MVGLHVGLIDTDLVRGIEAPKTPPEDVARIGLDAVEAGSEEVLVDDVSRAVKGGLSAGVYLRAISA